MNYRSDQHGRIIARRFTEQFFFLIFFLLYYSLLCDYYSSYGASRRMMSGSTTTKRPSQGKVIDAIRKQPVWLEDIGAYPVIFTCAFACVFAAGYIGWKFLTHPDVQIDKNKRGSVIRWWGDDSRSQLVPR
jgi:hypothetical protein